MIKSTFNIKNNVLAHFSSAVLLAAVALAPAHAQTGADAEKAQPAPLADMTMGAANAPVTVIEYASVTCPICAAFHIQEFPALKKRYIETGKVRFIFREFPAHNPRLTVAASMAARCAAGDGDSKTYFSIIDTLFETQAVWAEGPRPRDELLKIVAEAGMDEPAFDACLQRQGLLDQLNAEFRKGVDDYQVSGTPTFIVNGEKLKTSWKIDDFSKVIDAAIAKADKDKKAD